MAVEIKIPSVGESITEVTLASWSVQDGDFVREGDVVCEIESDKANLEITAEVSGTINTKVEEGQDLKIGAVIATLTPSSAPAPSAKSASESKTTEPLSRDTSTIASPAAKKILAEKGVESRSLQGSGKGGRITKADALAATKAEKKQSSSPGRNKRVEKMGRLRKTIAKRLTEAKNTTAMLTTFNEIDMSASMGLRKQYNEDFLKKYGIKIGFMSLFTKACCLALKEVPGVNGQIDGDNIVYFDYCDIGIAVSTPKGLVVPVVRNAEQSTLVEIERTIKDLAVKARDGKLGLEDMQGEPLRSPTVGFLAVCCQLRSSIFPKAVFLECTILFEGRWPSTVRLSSDP